MQYFSFKSSKFNPDLSAGGQIACLLVMMKDYQYEFMMPGNYEQINGANDAQANLNLAIACSFLHLWG